MPRGVEASSSLDISTGGNERRDQWAVCARRHMQCCASMVILEVFPLVDGHACLQRPSHQALRKRLQGRV